MALGKREVVTKGKASKKDNKPVALVTGKQFANQIKRWKSAKEQIAALTAEKESLEGDIRTTCYDEYIRLYMEKQKNPETIKIESEAGDQVMFMAVKKYTGSIDEVRALELRKKYGKTIVEEESEMIMNNDLLNKYSEQLEKLIMNAKFMTNEEKENLFVQKVTYKFRSDALDDGFTLGKGKITEFLSELNPVLMLKDVKADPSSTEEVKVQKQLINILQPGKQ